MNQKMTISYVLKVSEGCIIKKDGKNIGAIPVLVVETLAIRNALKRTIKNNYSRVIIESDSLLVLAIKGESISLKDIFNLVEDVIMLAKKSGKINFVYCRRSDNELADRITK